MPITIGAWSNEQTATSSLTFGHVAWNQAKTIGLAVGDGATLYRATASGAWAGVSVPTLFASPDSQRACGFAWGAGNTCVVACVNASGELELLYSTDGGVTWTEVASDLSSFDGISSSRIVLVESNGGSTFAVAALDPNDVSQFIGLVSTDSGVTFGAPFSGPAFSSAVEINSFYYDAVSGRWFISADTFGSSYSTDLSTWSAFVSYSGAEASKSLGDIVRFGSRLYAAGFTYDGSVFRAAILDSTNHGTSWNRLAHTGIASGVLPFTIAVVGDSLVIGCARPSGSSNLIFKSINGTAWTNTNDTTLSMSPTAVAGVAEGVGSRIYAVASDASFGGSTFRIVSASFIESANIVDVFSRGAVRYLLTIEGASAAWSNDVSLAGGASEGVTIYAGLMMEGALLSEHANLREGTTKISPLSLRVTGAAADIEFGKAPTKLAYLAESVTTVDGAEIEVTNDGLLSVGQYIHMGTECMRVEAIDDGTLAVTRMLRNTRPQAHYRAAVSSAPGWEVPIYDKPPTLQNRRVMLRAYPADSLEEEAIVYQGRLSCHPYQHTSGVSWCMDVDHLSTLLDQTIGDILAGDTSFAHAVYHQACQFSFTIAYLRAGVAIGPLTFAIEGAFETDDQFIAELQDQVDGLGTTGLTWTVYRNGGGLLVFEAATDTGFADDGSDVITDIRIGSAIDGVTNAASHDSNGRPGLLTLPDAATRYFVLNGTRRTGMANAAYVDSALQKAIVTTPRGCVGDPKVGVNPTVDIYESEDNTASEYMVYIARDIGCVSNRTVLTVTDAIWPVDGSRFTLDLEVLEVTDSGQTMSVRGWSSLDFQKLHDKGHIKAPCFYYDDMTSVSARVNYSTGSWRDLLQTVVNESFLANTGSTPFVAGADLEQADFFTDEMNRRVTLPSNSGSIMRRVYQPAIETALIDILRPELLLTTCLLRMSVNGLISAAPLMRPSPLSQTSIDIDDKVIFTPQNGQGAWPIATPTPDGIVCSVVIKDGGDDRAYRVVDEIALSHYKNRGAGTLEIELKSIRHRYDTDVTNEVSAVGKRILSFFGSAYSVITVPVLPRAMGVLVGDYVRLVSRHLIDPGTGLRGIDTIALCIGREWALHAPETRDGGELTLIAFPSSPGGYAPSALVAPGLGSVVGDYDELEPTTVTFTQNYYAPTGENDLDHFAVGDAVRLYAFDTTDTLGFRGVITSIPDAVTCVIDVTEYYGAWGARSLIMEFDSAAEGVTENQERYVYIADADGNVEGESGFDFE